VADVRCGSTSDQMLDVRDVWNPAGSRHGGTGFYGFWP
jgi:hypothetical protein